MAASTDVVSILIQDLGIYLQYAKVLVGFSSAPVPVPVPGTHPDRVNMKRILPSLSPVEKNPWQISRASKLCICAAPFINFEPLGI